jgi:hypothetical protein
MALVDPLGDVMNRQPLARVSNHPYPTHASIHPNATFYTRLFAIQGVYFLNMICIFSNIFIA